MSSRISGLCGLAAGLALLFGPATAWAHAFGARYDLPLPLGFYLVGAGAAVTLSFVIMAVFVRRQPAAEADLGVNLLALPLGRWLLRPAIGETLRILAFALFVLALATGLFGQQDTFKNLLPTLVWVIWWVGLAFVSALIGNLWRLVNPWNTAFLWAEALVRRRRPGASLSLDIPYPAGLGHWPAVGLFLIFTWLEIVSRDSEIPAKLAQFVLIYSAITWAGMLVFGRPVWLRHGEVFTVVFDLLARFAPLARPERDATNGEFATWQLRPFAAGLLTDKPLGLSMTVFTVTILATVTFDGFRETPLWADLLNWIASEPTLRPLLLDLRAAGFDLLAVLRSLALLVFPALFVGIYLIFAWLMQRAGGGAPPLLAVAGWFVLSLVPIAIAYHLAHYLSYLLLAGQMIIPLASDPFGYGWDLFGTAAHRIDISIVDAKFVWYAAVTAIVAGHVIAVVLAHLTCLRVFPDPRAGLRSQYPMLLLMVGYTMISLWILSQPVVES